MNQIFTLRYEYLRNFFAMPVPVVVVMLPAHPADFFQLNDFLAHTCPT